MTEHDEELPASKIVEQFGDEIRAAIAAVADETPTVAKNVAKVEVKNEARKSAVRWYITSLIMSLIMSLAVCWLMLNYAPRSHAADVTFERPDLSDVCTRSSHLSTEAHPIYICVAR